MILSEKQGLAPFIKIQIAESKLPERKTSFLTSRPVIKGRLLSEYVFLSSESEKRWV